MEVLKGDIYFVRGFVRVRGEEQTADRPAVVVSNNTGNYHSTICQVVYLTSQEKKPLPTHVPVMARVPSIAMCEQIHSVSQDRLVEYIRSCTEEEMAALEKGLLVSLGIECGNGGREEEAIKLKIAYDDLNCICAEQNKMINDLQAEIGRVEVENTILHEAQKKLEAEKTNAPETKVLIAERDLYKQQYEMLLDRLTAR